MNTPGAGFYVTLLGSQPNEEDIVWHTILLNFLMEGC